MRKNIWAASKKFDPPTQERMPPTPPCPPTLAHHSMLAQIDPDKFIEYFHVQV